MTIGPGAPTFLRMRRVLPLLWLLAAAPAQTPVQTPAPTLAGRVLTADGSRAANTTLHLRWRVAPELPGLAGITLGDRGLAETTSTTDERGDFRITLPNRGPFELTAERGDDRSPPRFPVLAGDFVELRLAPGFRVGGQLLGPDGAPRPATRLTLTPHDTAWNKLAAYRTPEPRGSTTTDLAGRFSLPFPDSYLRSDRWDGFVLLEADAPGLLTPRNALVRPTDPWRDFALRLGPTPDPGRTASGARRPEPPPLGAPAEDPITVRATLRTGDAPLANARILWSSQRGSGPPCERLATTDASGTVSLTTSRGRHPLLGFVDVGGRWLPFARVHDDRDEALGTVQVAARALRGAVLDPNGQPLPGARVAVLAAESLEEEAPYVTYTDHGGRFAFDALPPGPLDVWAEAGANGFAHAQIDGAAAEATLRTPKGGEITGTVFDEVGERAGGAWVMFVRIGADPDLMPGLAHGTPFLCVHTDAEGTVRVRGLPDARWRVMANRRKDGGMAGGGGEVQTGGDFTVRMQKVRE